MPMSMIRLRPGVLWLEFPPFYRSLYKRPRGGGARTKSCTDLTIAVPVAPHVEGYGRINLRFMMFGVARRSPELCRVSAVARWRGPLKVFNAVVRSVSVFMVNDFSLRGRPDEGSRDKSMDRDRRVRTLVAKTYAIISRAFSDSHKSGRATHTAKIAHFIDILKLGNLHWAPFFVHAVPHRSVETS